LHASISQTFEDFALRQAGVEKLKAGKPVTSSVYFLGMAASAIDLLFVRRIDIIRLFVRRQGMRPALTRDELRVQVDELINKSGEHPLQLFLNEIADGGRRHFYFFVGCKLDYQKEADWTARIASLAPQVVTLTRQFIPNTNEPVVRFEFEQEREERQPYPHVPPPLELEDGSRVEYSAERIFSHAILTYVDVNLNDGQAVAAIAQQERAGDYGAIVAAMQVQLTTTTELNWPAPRSLQHLAWNLANNPNIHTSEEKTKTSQGSVIATADNVNASLNSDPLLQQVRAITSQPNAIMKSRCCWVRTLHSSLSTDVTIWLNAWDNWLNLRQDATAADTRYVLNDIRNLL
jgi:hypothetical protein